MADIPIDWVNVNWLYVAVLAVFVFVTTFVADVLSFQHRGMAALLSAIFFAVIFVFWSYYPHHLPLPTTLNAEQAEPAGMPSQAQAPQRPRNPVTDITPPKNPVTDVTPPKPQ